MSSPSTLHSFDTIYPADSVEFCPSEAYLDYFVCGTYLLQKKEDRAPLGADAEEDSTDQPGKKPQTRLGKCWLFKFDESGHFDALQSFDLPAILDLKWSHSHRERPRVALADALGALHFYDMVDDATATSQRLKQVQTLQCIAETSICLSLDWSDRLHSESKDAMIVASISDGSLCTSKPADGGYVVDNTWHAHDYEPWIAAWNYWNPYLVYSGGDDLAWKAWDLRTDLQAPAFLNKRSFEGGVTSIQSHPHVEHLVAVGSYDGNIRIFDTRKPLRPLTTQDVGGGAWRVKWHPSVQRKDDLLVAGMHAGFKVIRWNSSVGDTSISMKEGAGEIIADFQGHASLAYGVDWRASIGGISSKEKTIIASCSFYDHLLKTWEA